MWVKAETHHCRALYREDTAASPKHTEETSRPLTVLIKTQRCVKRTVSFLRHDFSFIQQKTKSSMYKHFSKKC